MKLIKNGTLVFPEGSRKEDILIDGEKIFKIGENLQDGDAEVLDASGKLIFPGFIDAHTHFDLHVAGTVTADDFYSGTKAAVSGGTTTIIDFGTAYPKETLKQGMDNWLRKASVGCFSDYGIHQTITEWNPDISGECKDMMDAGVTTFKIYMTYDTKLDDKTILSILQRMKETGGIAGCHCENSGMIDCLRDEYVRNGRKQMVSSHYRTRPAAAEAEAVGRFLHLAEVADVPVIVVHLTCAEGLEEIRAARKRGQKVYAETCPQYLTMDESLYELPGFAGAKYVCAPPLRTKADQAVLWKAIADGEIQTVSTDHCSFTMKQKELGKEDFRKIPGGMPGVETRGSVIFSEGVAAGRITKEKMCEVLSENPAKLYGLYPRKGVLREGSDADLVILNPAAEKTVTAAEQVSKCDYAPLEGKKLTGVVEKVFLRGMQAAEDGKVLIGTEGKFLKRGKPGM